MALPFFGIVKTSITTPIGKLPKIAFQMGVRTAVPLLLLLILVEEALPLKKYTTEVFYSLATLWLVY